MTIEEMQKFMQGIGVKKQFFYSWEYETEAIMVKTRRPAIVSGGYLTGCNIVFLTKQQEFDVWTSQKNKAKAYAKTHGLKVRLLDGEAILWVPPAKADEILPKFGANVKRIQSEAQKVASVRALQAMRLSKKGPANAAVGAEMAQNEVRYTPPSERG